MLRRAVGDDSRVTFILLASLRTHLMRQPVLTVLTTLVVALSVALVIALLLSSRSVEQALSSSADALRGNADLEVTAGAVGMPESLLEAVSGLPGIKAAAPVTETTVRIAGGPKDGRPLRILGVDLLADQSVRSYTVVQRNLHVLDPLLLVAKSDSVIISEILARQLGLADGDTFKVRSTSGEHALVVRGLLAEGGVGDAYAGQLAVMDVYALQALLKREGWLDRIDLVLDPGADATELKAAVAAKVDGIATVRQPDPGNQLAGAAISTLGFLANVIALVGVLVSTLLCYAAIAASVDRRTRLFALFRAAGLEAKRIHRLVHVDSLAVGIAGVIVGTPFGIWLSKLFAAVFSQTSSWLSGLEIKPAPVSATVLLLGAGVGIGVSQLSAALASRRSTRLAPHEAIASGRGLSAEAGGVSLSVTWGATALLVCAWAMAWKVPMPIPGTIRAAALFALGVALLWTSIGPVLAVVLPLVRLGVERLAPGVGRVASGSLLMRLNQTRISSASIAAIIAVTSSLWIVTVSVVETLDRGSSYNGGEIITASDFMDQSHRDPLREKTVRAIAQAPGVDAVFGSYVTQVLFRGETVRLSAITSEVLADRIGLDLEQRIGSDPDVVRALETGGVVISDAFQRHFGARLGDSIELNTPLGRRDFSVVGVRPVYQTGSAGSIQMDLGTFDRYWARPGVSGLIVWTTGIHADVLDRIQKNAGAMQPLFLMSGVDMERLARDTLARYSGLVYALLSLVALLAGAAVLSLLVGASRDLQGDLALLQCLGASRSQLLRVVVVEGVAVGLAGVVAGLALAMALAVPVETVLTQEFGWSISWSIHPVELVAVSLGTVGIASLIGLVAATRLRHSISWSALAPE